MKTFVIRRIAIAAIIGLAAAILVAPALCADANSNNLAMLFQQGRAAYYKGDMATAKTLLTKVAAARPDHAETRSMLASIAAHNPPTPSVKTTYAGVTIPKVEFFEITVAEATQGLALMSKNSSAGKVMPNFIIKHPDIGAKRVTLTLTNVPMTDVIDYIAQLSGCKAVYDKNAVIFTSLTE